MTRWAVMVVKTSLIRFVKRMGSSYMCVSVYVCVCVCVFNEFSSPQVANPSQTDRKTRGTPRHEPRS